MNDKILYDVEAGVSCPFLPHHVEIHLADHCNLKCKCCDHFSNFATPHFYSLEQFRADLFECRRIFNSSESTTIYTRTSGSSHLHEIRMLGGEPTLTPHCPDYFKIARDLFSDTLLTFITNGVLLHLMKPEFWNAVRNYDIQIYVSNYPGCYDETEIRKIAHNYGVTINKTKEEWDFKNGKRVFRNFSLDPRETSNSRENQDSCVVKYCLNVYYGRLYRCCVMPYIPYLEKANKVEFEHSTKDYIDIYKSEYTDVIDYLKKVQPFCQYCVSTKVNKFVDFEPCTNFVKNKNNP